MKDEQEVVNNEYEINPDNIYDGEFEIQAACHFNVLYWQQLPPPPTE